jgi:hypothetical protein
MPVSARLPSRLYLPSPENVPTFLSPIRTPDKVSEEYRCLQIQKKSL